MRGRLDDPGQDQLEERLVADDVEPQGLPRRADGVDEQARGLRLHNGRARVLIRAQAEVENALSFLDLATSDLHQRCQLGIGVRGPEMLDNDVAAVLPAGDLHSHRTRRRLDLPQENRLYAANRGSRPLIGVAV